MTNYRFNFEGMLHIQLGLASFPLPVILCTVLGFFLWRCVKVLSRPVYSTLLVCISIVIAALSLNAQQNAPQIDPKTYGGLKWRLIGPFRGGRALAVTGVASQPNTYYFGAVPGGRWKTAAGGGSCDPLLDKQTTSSTS